MPIAGAEPPRRAMSNAHKAALARGRAQGHAVRRYLEAIEARKPKPGRRHTSQSIEKRLAAVTAGLAGADPLRRLHLLQEKGDLEAELTRLPSDDDMAHLEGEFVKVAQAYGERKGIGYATWRAAGVSAGVLQRAGITRASSARR